MKTASPSIAPDGQHGALAARLATTRQAVEQVARDTGAWLQAQRPRIAGLAVHTKQAGDVASANVADPLQALAATVFPKPRSPRMAAYLAELGRVLPALGGLRRSGAMALELAHLAAGRIDAFWEHDMAPWDAAAALVMLQEVGAQVLARDHLPLLHSASLAACTPAMADSFLALLEGAAR